MPQFVIGVDVAKDWIDARERNGKAERIEMRPAPLRRFAKAAAKAEALVVFEASGGHDRPLRAALEGAGAAYSRVNPAQARQFARALGVTAKTDRVDAGVLAEMGARLELAPSVPLSPAEATPSKRRRQLVEARKRELTRFQQTQDQFARRSITRVIALHDREIAAFRGRDRRARGRRSRAGRSRPPSVHRAWRRAGGGGGPAHRTPRTRPVRSPPGRR